jgi:hypothetical protein
MVHVEVILIIVTVKVSVEVKEEAVVKCPGSQQDGGCKTLCNGKNLLSNIGLVIVALHPDMSDNSPMSVSALQTDTFFMTTCINTSTDALGYSCYIVILIML